MSAIIAIVRTDCRAAQTDAARMITAMGARSPDGIRVWSEGHVGLGHGALYTTPEAATERLPLARAGGRLAITADARLDNRTELLRELQIDSAAGDGELTLAAYERWGELCPTRLLGDFAFAIWHARTQSLFCACDRFAVKPLYWYRSDDLWVVATEIEALLAVDDVPRRLDEQRFADFLTLHAEDPMSTIYRDIYRLPPAHAMTTDRNGTWTRRYWSLDPSLSLDLHSDAEYEETFRVAFTDAVTARLRARGRVAAKLSGGLDSSSVVVVARHLLLAHGNGGLPLPTISASFAAVPDADEREYQEALFKLGCLEPHFVFPEDFGPLEDWPGAAWRGAEPELIPQRNIMRAANVAAAELGTNCLLDGEAGDIVVSHGFERLTDLARKGCWISLLRETSALARRANFTPGTKGLLRSFAISPFIPDPLWRFRQGLRQRGTAMPHWAGGVPLGREFVRRESLEQRYGASESVERKPRNPRCAHARLLTAASLPLGLSIADRIAGLLGVEPRYPFLDSRLVELCVAVPPEQKLRDGYSRDLLRRALQDLLPPKIRFRASKGMPGAHISHALPARDRHIMDQVILDDSGPITAYINLDAVKEQYRQCLLGATSDDWYPIWRVVVGSLWMSHAQSQWALEI